jgi:hypothetical protein
MPKNQVTDPITDQEIAFAHLVLTGSMTDRRAAEAVGLNPDTAAYTKAKPRVRDYMLEHQAAVREQLVQKEAEGLHQRNLGRDQVLTRLWEIANLSPELTRNSITGQVKALQIIVALEGLIPDRRAGARLANSSAKNSTPPPPPAQFYKAEWLRRQEAKTAGSQPAPDLVRDGDGPDLPGPEAVSGVAADAPPDPSPAAFDPTGFAVANRLSPTETTPSAPHARVPSSAPDNRVPFSLKKNPFARRR